MPSLPRGLTRTPKGWRITLRIQGRLWQKRYPPSTPYAVMVATLESERRRQRAGRATALSGTLAGDVRRYLQAYYAGRPGYDERQRHLGLWIDALGADTWRRHLTRELISTVLQQWRASGLAAETCNKRRTALLAMWNALDGRASENPVREVPKFRVQPAIPRAISFPDLRRLFRHCSKSKTRARLKVMAYTGARPIQVMHLTPADWNGRTLMLRGTGKGAGTRDFCIPLSHDAEAAMKEFNQTDAWGRFTLAPAGRLLKAAAVKAGLSPDIRPYDLRHSFGTEVYRLTGDIRVTKELMGHATITMTERYTLAAIPERQHAAVAAFNRARRRAKVATA